MSNAPIEFITALFSAFSKLKQRVVIKWQKGMNPGNSNTSTVRMGIPENVWIDDWFSQQDILGN